MNKILFFLLTLFTLAVVGCSTSRTYYTEYDTTDISYVVDSIVSSGTVMIPMEGVAVYAGRRKGR